MKKFKFRLQKVLEYRQLTEKWAKEAFLEARLNVFECEGDLEDIQARRRELLKQPVGNLQEHRTIEILLERTDDLEREKQAALQVLRDEEAAALEAWKLKRQELQALERLQESALSEWQDLANKKEQAELDEWAATRKVA